MEHSDIISTVVKTSCECLILKPTHLSIGLVLVFKFTVYMHHICVQCLLMLGHFTGPSFMSLVHFHMILRMCQFMDLAGNMGSLKFIKSTAASINGSAFGPEKKCEFKKYNC